MKRNFSLIFAILGVISLFCFTSCKKEEVTVNFKINYETEFTVPSGSVINLPFNLFSPDITTNSQAEFEANDTRKDKIQEIKLASLKLAITSPQGQNFDFLKHIYLYIKAEGVPEQRYAFIENIADGQTELNLIAENVDLAAFIKQDKFSLRAETVQDKSLNQNADIKANMVFAVKANPLK